MSKFFPGASGRRWRAYPMDPSVALYMLTTGRSTRVVDGVPEGSKVIGWYDDMPRARVVFLVEHASFDAVQDGEEPPEQAILVETIDGGSGR